MKKLLLALTAVAAFSGSALAADLPARAYTKAPPPIMAPSWTGFYIFGGAGGGLWAADQHTQTTVGGLPLAIDQRNGGSGWFGTVGAGYDWQVNPSWVVGVFGFVVMLASTVMLIQNVRRIGRRGIEELRQSIGSRSLADAVEDAARRLRQRFGRDGS